MNNTTFTNSTIADCLVDNNRFATRKLTADQLGAESFRSWTDSLAKLHLAAYSIYAKCENDNLAKATQSLDLTPLFDVIRGILDGIGDINGHKVYPTAELATLIIGYSGKRANSDSPELQLTLSKIRNRKKELTEYEKTNGVNPDAIKAMKDEIAVLEEIKDDLLAQPDNRIKKPTRTSDAMFRLEVEHRFARVIAEQMAKSWEELEAEAEARKAERKAKNKARKAAKKAEEKAKAEAEANTNA